MLANYAKNAAGRKAIVEDMNNIWLRLTANPEIDDEAKWELVREAIAIMDEARTMQVRKAGFAARANQTNEFLVEWFNERELQHAIHDVLQYGVIFLAYEI